MDRLFLLVICVFVPLVACNRPSHCERHRGNSEFRCAKDGHRTDYIHIQNIVNDNISFSIGKWLSSCGKPGVNYSDHVYSLGPQGSMDEIFSEVASGVCNELFIYKCKQAGSAVDCLSVVSAYPKD